MAGPWSKALGAFLLFAGGVGLVAYFFPVLLGAAAGPEAAVLTALKRTERDGLRLAIANAPGELVSKNHHFDRVTVLLETGGREAVVVATLDFEGTLGKTRVSSLGLERVSFQYREGEWRPVSGFAPTLSGVVAALWARRAALEAGDGSALRGLSGAAEDGGEEEVARVLALSRRKYEARAWYVRSDPEGVTVTEDFRLEGALPDRPVDEKGSKRLWLERSGNRFLFSHGLM